jgi:type VI secretion system protein ImpA
MGSLATLDLDRLLAPVSEDNPAGEDLRSDASPSSAYYQLKDLRKAARAKERQLTEEDGEEKQREIPDTRSHWRPILQQTVELLSTRSKDVELLAWLIEAQVRLHGFPGLRDGFQLALGFVDSYWDSFFPHEEDVADRIAALAGLNGQEAEGTLIMPIRNVPITEAGSLGPFASWHYQQAVSLQQMADAEARERRIGAGAVTMEMIDKAGLEADADFLRAQFEDLRECRIVFDKLTARLDELCGAEAAPPSSNIKNELTACMQAVQHVGRRVDLEQPADGADEAEAAADSGTSKTGMPATDTAQMTREQAFQQLLQLASYFRRTEPHSPLSYSIERVVRWGQMPLPELLNEIVTEENARNNLFWLAGINKPGNDG